MGTLIAVYALIVLGLLLCFIGRFPGQILAYAGLLVAAFALKNHLYPTWILIVCGVLVIASIIINKITAPKLAAKVHEFGKPGKLGTIVGSILSLFLIASISNAIVAIICFILFPYIFAFLFEFVSQKNAVVALKRAIGAYTLFLTTTLINVAISAFCFAEVVYGWI